MDELHHECGIAAIYHFDTPAPSRLAPRGDPNQVSRLMPRMLPDLAQVFRNLSRRFDGAYSLAFLNAMGDMAILRDPQGFRPLCYAIDGPPERPVLFAAASESVPLQHLGFTNIKSLEPGEMILIQ